MLKKTILATEIVWITAMVLVMGFISVMGFILVRGLRLAMVLSLLIRFLLRRVSLKPESQYNVQTGADYLHDTC